MLLLLSNGLRQPRPTIITLSNSMDISQLSNWPRVEEWYCRKVWLLSKLGCTTVSDESTKNTLCELAKSGYISEPHTAMAYRVLRDQLLQGEFGLFLGTAHPSNFKYSAES